MSYFIVDNFVRYKFCTTFFWGRIKIMTRICFCLCVFAGKKNYFILYNKTTEKRGILHSWIANRLWGNCIALVTQNCLSINQSTNQTINTLRRNQSQQPFQTSRNQFSLSNLPEAHREHSLSSHPLALSLSFSSLSSSFSFFPEKIGWQLHDFTLIFLDFFLLFYLIPY